MMRYSLYINGTGNAWPVPLGENHPFYNKENCDELANASFSILASDKGKIKSEILFDAGHGIVQYLLRNRNRIPEAIVISHPHLDHTLSLDWISQSFYKKWKKQRKYPVYCTDYCFEKILQTYPHLVNILNHNRLIPGIDIEVAEFPGMTLGSFPVYHGQSAFGATSVLFTINGKDEVIATGDILLPLFRVQDYFRLMNIPYLVTDANNRFPYPKSNHWSVQENISEKSGENQFLRSFRMSLQINDLLQPYGKIVNNLDYFTDLRFEFDPNTACLSINDLIKKIHPGNCLLMHYSGDEDYSYNGQVKLGLKELENWCKKNSLSSTFKTNYSIPTPGTSYHLGT